MLIERTTTHHLVIKTAKICLLKDIRSNAMCNVSKITFFFKVAAVSQKAICIHKFEQT